MQREPVARGRGVLGSGRAGFGRNEEHSVRVAGTEDGWPEGRLHGSGRHREDVEETLGGRPRGHGDRCVFLTLFAVAGTASPFLAERFLEMRLTPVSTDYF